MTQHQTIVPDTDFELKIERDFNAPIETLFDAWTNQDVLKKWMGPQSMSCPDATCDPKLGGDYCFPMTAEDGGVHTVIGSFTEFAPPNSLSFTWSWTQDDGSQGHQMEVFVKFKILSPNKTRMTLLHTNLMDLEAKDRHEEGWVSTLVCLKELL